MELAKPSLRDRLESYICNTVGCSSRFARRWQWPQRLICMPLSNTLYNRFVTRTGRVLTHMDIWRLAREAEAGYPAEQLVSRNLEQWNREQYERRGT